MDLLRNQDYNLLIGRENELERFQSALATRSRKSPGLFGTTRHPAASPYVFLISGEGGIGKTRLVRALREVIEQESPYAGQWRILHIDWEDKRGIESSLKVARGHVDPRVILKIMAEEIQYQLDGSTPGYDKSRERLNTPRQRVRSALSQESQNGDFAHLAKLGFDELVKLLTMGHEWCPPFQTMEIDELLTLANRFLDRCLEGTDQLRDDFLRPYQALSSKLGQDLRKIHPKGILICMDTHELIQGTLVDQCLQSVIRAAGPHIIWVIAGRHNLTNDPDSPFFRYRERHPETVEIMHLQSFSEQQVRIYMKNHVPHRPLKTNEAGAIHQATGGIPLAVKLAAEMWEEGADLKAITETAPSNLRRRGFVVQMVNRFLRHCIEPHTADRDAIYTLAMMRHPDKDLLRNVLVRRAGEDLHRNLPRLLEELEKRYSFVLPGGKIEDVVLRFLQEYLLIHRHNMDRDALSRLGCDSLKQRTDKMLPQRNDVRLWELWSNPDWVEATLDLIHLKFWKRSENDGWQQFAKRFLEALAYGELRISELLAIARFFQPYLSDNEERWFNIFDKAEHAGFQERQALVEELVKLEELGWLNGSTYGAERMVILKWQEGECHRNHGDHHKAFRCFQEAGNVKGVSLAEIPVLSEKFATSHLRIAQALVWPEDEQRTTSNLEIAALASRKALGFGLETADAYYTSATVWSLLGNYEETVNAVRKAINLDSTIPEYWKLLGLALLELKDTRGAAEALEHAVRLNGRDPDSYLKLGQIYYDSQEHQKAHDAYQQAIDLKPEEVIAHSGRGHAYFAQKAYREAKSAYKQAVALAPDNAQAHANLANACLRLRQKREAARAYRTACKLDRDWPYPHYQLGRIHARFGEFDKAIKELEKTIELQPQNMEAYYWLGTAYYESLEYLGADDAYRRAMAIDGQFALAHYGQGRALLQLNELQKAREAFKAALELAPNEKLFCHYLSEVYYALQEYSDALEACRRTERLAPKFAPLYVVKGNTCYALQMYKEAKKAYEQASELEKKWPNLPWALVHSRLGELYYVRQEFPDSIVHYSKAIELGSADAWLYHGRGLAYYVQGHHPDAINDFQQAIQQDPNLLWAYNGLGAVYLNTGDLSEAEKSYQKAIKQSRAQNSTVHLSLGVIYLHQGKQEEGTGHLGQVTEIYALSLAGIRDRCCHVMAQLGQAQTPNTGIQEWSSYLQEVQAAGGHHLLKEWLGVSELMPEPPVGSSNLLDDYLTPLKRYVQQLAQ